MDEVASLVKDRVCNDMKQTLFHDFSAIEVLEAVNQMHPSKALRSDGTSKLFYQTFWSQVGDDVIRTALNILNSNGDTSFLNNTYLTLIPKAKKSNHASQFWPIGLYNVIFKIITNTIANRLKKILSPLVSGNQNAFVLGGLITNDALSALKKFHCMKTKQSGRKG